jgi:N-methylhydantoinase B
MAVLRELRYLGDKARLQLRSDRRHHPPFGVHGGGSGAPSRNLFDNGTGGGETWEDLPTKFVHPLRSGQAIRHITAGGGGYGDPYRRPAERVLEDVRNGKVSAAAAARDYGVAVAGPPWRVDEAKTEALRDAGGE